MLFPHEIPLSLYIHLPWCVKKCPYCDFNSFKQTSDVLPEDEYITALLQDLQQELPRTPNRPLISLFIGGGTPSLFSPKAISRLLTEIRDLMPVAADAEITMEANPGTFEQERFAGFREAGVNRLSLGVQSFNIQHLAKLGRIHGAQEAILAASSAKKMGFNSINIDLMYALPTQTLENALDDLKQAIALSPDHLSWYHLTIEPNTAFYRKPPKTPEEESVIEMETAGRELLAAHGFDNYEVSAYAQAGMRCLHNRNYWEFGDYLGIGAGAHSKITLPEEQGVLRFWKHRLPHHYLNPEMPFTSNQQSVDEANLIFEFMLNALRLTDGFSRALFEARTGLGFERIRVLCEKAGSKGLLGCSGDMLIPTTLGKRFLNNLVEMFLP